MQSAACLQMFVIGNYTAGPALKQESAVRKRPENATKQKNRVLNSGKPSRQSVFALL